MNAVGHYKTHRFERYSSVKSIVTLKPG